MHNSILAKRNAAARERILRSADLLATHFDVSPDLVQALKVGEKDPLVKAMRQSEAAADLLEAIAKSLDLFPAEMPTDATDTPVDESTADATDTPMDSSTADATDAADAVPSEPATDVVQDFIVQNNLVGAEDNSAPSDSDSEGIG